MKISIFGLGYVGVVTSACLSSKGHKIIGVDVNDTKVQMMNEGKSPIVEEGVTELLSKGKKKGLVSATKDSKEAVLSSDISIISVGTPSRANGSLDIKYLEKVSEEIGLALKEKDKPHYIVFRSTMLPETVRGTLIPIIEKYSKKKQNKGFFVAFNPEFLRESTAVYDFNNPPKTVVGADSEKVAEKVMKIYDGIPGPKIKTELEVAETVKYVDNVFHALKITFGNEIGLVCKSLGIDSHKVMDIFVQDEKLNISKAYLKPGFAFGGSCLPKDTRALNYLARSLDTETPLISSLIPSNENQIKSVVKRIMAMGKKKIGIAGFAFKANTDDMRESPIVEVIEILLGKGYDLKIYDKSVSLARLTGANKTYLEKHIPHISNLMVDSVDELIKDRDVIIIGNSDPQFKKLLKSTKKDQIIFDLVRIDENGKENYEGLYW